MLVIFCLIIVGAIVAVGAYALLKLKKRIQLMEDVIKDFADPDELWDFEKDYDSNEACCCDGKEPDCCKGDCCKK